MTTTPQETHPIIEALCECFEPEQRLEDGGWQGASACMYRVGTAPPKRLAQEVLGSKWIPAPSPESLPSDRRLVDVHGHRFNRRAIEICGPVSLWLTDEKFRSLCGVLIPVLVGCDADGEPMMLLVPVVEWVEGEE